MSLVALAIMSTVPSLAIATRPVARHVARPRRSAPVLVVATILAGTIAGSLVLPLGAFGLLACAAMCGAICARPGNDALRRLVATSADRRAWRARREARARTLEMTFGGITLAELTNLADEIEDGNPELASRLDLEGLLDRFVELTVSHERAVRAAGMSDRRQLERMRELARGDANPRRLELAERRLRCLDECETRVRWFADELALLAELLRLVAQRVACPDAGSVDDMIERELAELDEDDAIRGLIAGELHAAPGASD